MDAINHPKKPSLLPTVDFLLRKLHNEYKYTEAQIAKKCNISKATVIRIIKGRQNSVNSKAFHRILSFYAFVELANDYKNHERDDYCKT